MKLSVSYGMWRFVRVSLVVIVLSLIHLVLWWMLGLFIEPVMVGTVLAVVFPCFLICGVLLLGTPDQAEDVWQEKQLLATRELYSSLYDLSPVPYLTLNKGGKVTTANKAAARLFGITLEELIGQAIIERLRHDDENKWSMLLGKLQANTSVFDTEIAVVPYKGEEKWVLFSLYVNQTFDQQLVSLVDISHQKAIDRAKSEFVSLATHQLRTPVAAMRWNVELLEKTLRGTASEKQTNYLSKIDRNVGRMLALINDFLSVSKLETGTFATESERLLLKDYLTTVVDEYQQAIMEKQIALTTSFVPDTLEIMTDQRLFHIITSNLLSNAVKYVRPSDSIHFGYELIGSEVVITVKDTGIGVPSEQIPQLFSKFFRASNAMVHKAEGTGLGLYIVKESVSQLHGTIDVQSEEGKGTTFTVKLPIA